MPLVTTKKKCCQDSPRCKTCPVVLMRLERAGHAECCAVGKKAQKTYRVDKKVPKKDLKDARRR